MTLRRSIPVLILFLLVCASGPDLYAQKKKTPAKKPAAVKRNPALPSTTGILLASSIGSTRTPEQQRRYDTFVKVWQTINDNYFDPTFGGLNWGSIRQEFNPRVSLAKTDDELYLLLEEMIGRLHKSHFAIVPPEVYSAIETAKTTARLREKMRRAEKDKNVPAGEEPAEDEAETPAADEDSKYGIGIDLRLVNDQFWITRVLDGSAAQKAGLKAGYIIEKINGVSLRDLLKRIESRYAQKRSVKNVLAGEVVIWMLNGAEGTDVGLTYLNEKDEPKEVRIDREKLTGRGVSIGRNYPEQYLSFEERSIGDDVGYIRFNLFAMPVIADFCAALTVLKDKKALIVDLRGNHGGLFGALMGVSGMLSDTDVELGTQIFRSGTEKLRAVSKAKNFKGKIVFLVDETSISSAEILAAAMQESGRATIVGEKTAGEALPAMSVALETGAVLVYPIANLKTSKGAYIEGSGVTPDIAVNLDRKSLLEGRDVQLDAALKVIKENAPAPAKPVITFDIDAQPPLPKATPPPPAITGRGSGSGNGTGVLPPPPSRLYALSSGQASGTAAPPPPIRDQRSSEVVSAFFKKIGGEEAIRKIESYTVSGIARIRIRGAEEPAEATVYRRRPEKYAESFRMTALGEIRELYTKDSFVLQADFGVVSDLHFKLPYEKRELLGPLFSLADKGYLSSMSYAGVFDRVGKKVHVINAKSSDGDNITLAFDVATGLLVSYEGLYYKYSLGDYQKVKDLMLPFWIDRGSSVLTIYDVKINTPIDESNFQRKINCFDKPN